MKTAIANVVRPGNVWCIAVCCFGEVSFGFPKTPFVTEQAEVELTSTPGDRPIYHLAPARPGLKA